MQDYNSPDVIIHNGMLVTMNGDFEIIENGFLTISGNRIADFGPGSVDTRKTGAEIIDAQGGLVLPGLINAHTHAAMTCLRGLADDMPLMTWLDKFVFPVEANITKEMIYWGTLLACLEMIRSGTTTFCDMYLFEHEVARAAKEAGMRALVGEVLYDFPSPNYGSIENGFHYTENLIQEWRHDPLILIGIEPHAPYTCSPFLYERANLMCHDYDVPLITHLSESERELHICQERYGTTPVLHLDRLGILGSHVIGDHCVCVTDQEIEAMAQRGVRVVHNPESNMKLAVGVAPVPQMLKRGITLGLGTDGCASNNNLNMFGEMDMAAKLHKVANKDTTIMDARTVLSLATLGGARALGLGDLVGSLERGKLADMIILDIHKPHLTPFYQPYSHLVYAANGSEVTTSIINGRIIMRDNLMVNLDEERIMAKAVEIGRNIRAFVHY
jgi:5-methylthioadenosine/S-adenosylhomocysteine deaminase